MSDPEYTTTREFDDHRRETRDRFDKVEEKVDEVKDEITDMKVCNSKEHAIVSQKLDDAEKSRTHTKNDIKELRTEVKNLTQAIQKPAASPVKENAIVAHFRKFALTYISSIFLAMLVALGSFLASLTGVNAG